VATTSMGRAGVALGLLALAGCASTTEDGGSAAGGTSSSEAGPPSAAVLRTAGSPLGQIAVDADGFAVYVFDQDTAGTSTCTGSCADLWPPVTADTADPVVDGVTGDVGTITRDDGTLQVTLEDRPLYTYAADSDAGDVTGQGVEDVWWVVAVDEAAVTDTPSSEPAPVPGY
jgi:predicted lipoprotein with Yx(FWY)xxD motif